MAGKFDLKISASGKYMFNLLAGNHQIILTSQLYESKDAAENGIDSIKNNASEDGSYERKQANNGEPFFVLKAANGQVIGKSELYSGVAAMENGIESVKKNGPTAEVADNT